MNQNFSISKILHQSSKLEHFQWRYKSRNKNFEPLKSLGSQQLSYLQYFGLGVKIHHIALKRRMVILADNFCSSIVIFSEFYLKFDNNVANY